jgi:hypothetical protein
VQQTRHIDKEWTKEAAHARNQGKEERRKEESKQEMVGSKTNRTQELLCGQT